ncbi:MAG: CopG family transcriptional regulator [Thermoproteus sp.]
MSHVGRRNRRPSLKHRAVVTTYLPEEHLENLEALVRLGIFRNRSEVAEAALEELFKRYDVSMEDEDIEAIRGR